MTEVSESPLAALRNDGLCVLNAARPPARRTLVVAGLARSGTTMVAGALHHLGIDMMGGAAANAVYEDLELSRALEAGDTGPIRRLVAIRNAAGRPWGWKRPSSLGALGELERHFTNPRYVVVFRDMLAIATRNRVSMRANVVDNLAASYRQYGVLLEWVRQVRAPTMLVSYEKAMLDKAAFVSALATFAGADAAGCTQAVRFIRRDSPRYLRASRNWGGKGRLGRADCEAIAGWACWPDRGEAVDVRISVNGRTLATVTADLQRQDIRRRGLHASGNCGFLYRCGAGEVRAGDVVTARIAGDVIDLPGSGMKAGAAPPVGAKPRR
ncbi:sulfotransferase [Sinimarinibacterium flocculans]|uniref:Sulfotransferase family protein n=1 Tax=Sinimarinibacterium flocculans TaxID=985250 RepID=A0A318EGS1_9GAMM|nr:sulfotransferase [Sinimarinibacterium flocculans]PXV69758.1 hypothetical protein C8D93_103334 [Sinimarinibacterium flocculans]